jgi:putative endonuclease
VLGGDAEALAARHLESLGYRLVARNVRSRRGELDLVARDGKVLCFVEVRLRRTPALAAESVDARKQRSLIRAAQQYLAANRLDVPCRFDVVTVSRDGVPTLLRNAFTPA